jgi:hypothetical protein
VGTEHLLLSLVEGLPDGPARTALTSAGVVPGVVRRALEAITGPGGAPLHTVSPSVVRAGDRALPVLARAVTLAELGSIADSERGPVGGPPPPPGDVHVLVALVTADDPGLALLVLEQSGAIDKIKRALLPADPASE